MYDRSGGMEKKVKVCSKVNLQKEQQKEKASLVILVRKEWKISFGVSLSET